MLNEFKKYLRVLLGRTIEVSPQVKCEREYLGTEYGGWYVNPALLSKDSVIYSGGLGDDISFDLAFIDRFDAQVHGFDPTPRAREYVQSQETGPKFHYHELALYKEDTQLTFYPLEEATNVNFTLMEREQLKEHAVTAEARRIKTIMHDLGHDMVDVLKLDIEGAEYPVLESLLADQVNVGQILIEFHHRFPEVGLQKTKDALAKLASAGYLIFAATAGAREISFVRKDLLEQ